MKFSVFILSVIIFSTAMKSIAATGCGHQARTPLEELFCQIQLSPAGSSLPSFADFRRNQPKIQALLLKRPARILGLDVPVPAATPSGIKNGEKELKRTTAQTEKIKPPSIALQREQESVDRTQGNSLSECQLGNNKITCKNRFYELLDNQHNRHLVKGALSENNLLGMMRFTGSVDDEAELNNYLAESYELYIQKMIDIGLGGVTMSYTKFYYTFMELVDSKENFADRFETMYGFLKKNKSTMLVGRRVDDQMPSGLQECMDLNEALIVCDNLSMNWVYQLK